MGGKNSKGPLNFVLPRTTKIRHWRKQTGGYRGRVRIGPVISVHFSAIGDFGQEEDGHCYKINGAMMIILF